MHISDLEHYFNLYRQWAKEDAPEDKNIQIFYISAYGNTEAMAKFIANTISEKGIRAEAHEITSMNMGDMINLIEKSSGILIGSPTINQDAVEPAWNLLAHVSAITNRGKIGGAFGSYGWSGEGVPMINSRLKDLKFKVLEEGFKFNFVPSQNDFEAAKSYVENFLQLNK